MKRQIGRLSLAALLFAADGCMVGPHYKPPSPTMPANYREPINGATTAPASFVTPGEAEITWWRRLGDEKLTNLVEKAVKANYSVAVAEAHVREARAARQVVQSLLYPQVGIGASALRYKISDSVVSLPGINTEDNLFTLGFDAAWVVDVFGGTRRGVEAAKANEQASAAERRGSCAHGRGGDGAGVFGTSRYAARELQIAQSTLEEQRQTLAVTEDKFRNGLASNLQVLRARTEVEGTAAEIPPLQQAIRQYIHVLSTLLGLEPTALSDELEQSVPIPTASGQMAVGIPSDLLRRRPDVQSAERQLASATAQVGVAAAQLFPQMVLGGSAGLQSREFGDLFNGNSTNNGSSSYLAGPAINWTLFDAGRRKAGVKFAEAQVDAAKANYQDIVLRAFREVESSLVAIDRAREQVGDLKRLSASAREAAAISRRDYERGILDQLTVLDAQRQSNRADMLLAQGELQLVINVVTLYKALGGGWEVAEPAPATQPVAISGNKGNLP